ncbi:MAG: serine hydrolase domain-containing protein [Chloroherpetonaceae bacterium]|nr:serine hydrolase domain-containing protein [Chloroherpetonaceae bacterium]
MNVSIAERAFPGGVVGVIKNGRTVFLESFGKATYDSSASPISIETVFDLASVTKPLTAGLLVMKLYEENRIRLSDTLGQFLPQANAGSKGKITIRQLLTHSSGLVAFRRYHDTLNTTEKVLNAIYQDSLFRNPGDTTIYSDINFVLLGKIVEKIYGKNLSDCFDEQIARPMKLNRIGFHAGALNQFAGVVIAPVEKDTLWKMSFERPLVHDPTSAKLSGISANAGLFGDVKSVLSICTMLLDEGIATVYDSLEKKVKKVKIFEPTTVKRFTTRDTVLGERALGFDMKSNNEKTSAGRYMTLKTFGHLGYTGTSFWIDPIKKVAIVLLTNRVYPNSLNNAIRGVRRKVSDAAMKALEKNPKEQFETTEVHP